jgi:hypothetical protein
MGALRRHCVRLTLVAVGVVLLIALATGAIRLLPWLLAPEVPLEISAPFAVALAAVATEATVLVALPVGFALAAAVFVDRGEARALLALGAPPQRIAFATLPVALTFALVACASIASWDAETGAPGRFATQLIEHGRASCDRASEPRSALVPLVSVTWLCFPGRSPRVAGPLPRSAGRAWFTARSLEPSDDLRTFLLGDLRLLMKTDSKVLPRIRVHADRASVSGLPRWGRPARLPIAVRAVLISGTAVWLALLSIWSVVRAGGRSRLLAASLAALGALSALWVLQRADQATGTLAVYSLIPTAGAGVLLAAAWVVRLVPRRLPRFRLRYSA